MLGGMSPQKISFNGHAVALFAAAVYILPIEFLGLGAVKRAAWLLCMWTTIGEAMLTIKANSGAPPLPENMSFGTVRQMMSGGMGPELQGWLQKAMLSTSFHFLFFALIFVTAYPSLLPALVLGRRSLWTVGTHCAKNPADGGRLWAMFAPRWEQLKAKEAEVLHYSAVAEILIAFWLTISLLLPTRQIFACFLYWNYLKTRYAVPRSRALHEKAWRQIGGRVEPLLKMAPFLQKPIDMAKGWFQPQYQAR